MKVITEEYKLGLDYVWANELNNNAEDKAAEKLPKNNPTELLEEFAKVIDKDDHLIDAAKYRAIMSRFADDLHLISRQVFSAILEEDLGKIWEKLNETEKNFGKHRHALDKPYSEKPSW